MAGVAFWYLKKRILTFDKKIKSMDELAKKADNENALQKEQIKTIFNHVEDLKKDIREIRRNQS